MSETPTHDDQGQLDAAAVVRRMRFLMENQRVLVQDFAHDVGVKRAYLLEVLDGRTQPTPDFLKSVASYFGVTVDFLRSGRTITARKEQPRSRGGTQHGKQRGTQRGKQRGKQRSKPRSGRRAPREGGSAVADLAVRHQALVECLIDKGLITASEYNAWVERVSERNA